jgi:3-isopropylmalate/(R)-2-methylmalate dehydratase large subunit
MSRKPVHIIRPARFKPGVTADDLPGRGDDDGASHERDLRPIRGKALIFWDPQRKGKKLDAIDTDQITPSKYCVSESLDALDEKWKEGAFKFLMPDFRARIHRGETFVIAGDRFAIGSSREMSPAGLKAVAEEVGAELVIICGNGMGDIFRRNALNLGLHVVQCPDAVEDAADGNAFSFDPATRKLTNESQKKTYDPLPLTSKEDEIRQSGGIVAVGRREFAPSAAAAPRIEWPDEDTGRRMTATEQIVWAHRVDKTARVKPGVTLRVYADLLPASDGTAPFAIHTFNQITGGDSIDPRQLAIANDHFVFTGDASDERQTAIGRAFAEKHGIKKPYYATPGDGIFHFYFPEQGLIYPVGFGVGSTTLGFGWSAGYVYFTLAKARRIMFRGRLQPWVSGKDIVLSLLEGWGAKQSQGMSVEFVDQSGQLPMAYRNTITNMMAEAEAQNGIFAPDDVTYRWYREKGIVEFPYPLIRPGREAHYEIDETLDLSDVVPMISKPFSPGNAFPADEVAKERLTFDKAYIGSCTNGSYDDLLQAALVLQASRQVGLDKVTCTFVIFPGSRDVKTKIEKPELRLKGESVADVLRAAGGTIRDSWCGPCFGQGEDALARGERAITSFNRNWQNRMGVGGEGYLASPAVVAASALLGYMGPPGELAIEWKPELYGV